MKKIIVFIPSIVFLLFTLSSCEAIETIFKAGVWSGIIIVVLVIFLILLIINKVNKKN